MGHAFGVVGFALFTLSLAACVGDSTSPSDASTNDATTGQDVATQDVTTSDSGPADGAGDGNDGGLTPLVIQPSVAVGYGFSCALRSTGRVYCWGKNDDGQLGNLVTSASPTATPSQVASITTGARIAAGLDFVCVVLTDHHVSCWGANGAGQLGQSPTPNNPSPTTLTKIDSVMDIAAGGSHVCARKIDGSVWCWGGNYADQLGYANTTDSACEGSVLCNPTPTQVQGITAADGIAAGLAHSCARIGAVAKCWGANEKGELGHIPGQNGDLGSTNDYYNASPTPASATAVGALFAGANITCMLDGTQKVSCWGNDSTGQLGDKAVAGQSSAPIAVTNMPAATSVAAAYLSACAISSAGVVYCWGDDEYGELGNGVFNSTLYYAATPNGLSGKTMESISGSPAGSHWCALVNDGSVYCWGTNNTDELGHSNTTDATCNGQKCSGIASTVTGLP